MRSEKRPEELDRMCESTMRYITGAEVIAVIDNGGRYFYVWLEPSDAFESFCFANGREELLTDLENELERIGVHQFRDMVFVNAWLKSLCGDDDPAQFDICDYGFICEV